MPASRRKIFVAMSGGVDSSVAAALLSRAGHDVTGVFMKNWSDTPDPCTGDCGWTRERADALRVAAHLGIPLLTYDFEEEYRRGVVDYLVAEYAAGRTPNPDVMCNKLVKFDLFLKRALAEGADLIATGTLREGGRMLSAIGCLLNISPWRRGGPAGADAWC